MASVALRGSLALAPQDDDLGFQDSLLTNRTPEGRAAILGEALDDAAASPRRARLAFTIINPEAMLEVAELAGGLAVIAQRRASGLDRIAKHRTDCLHKMRGTFMRCT